MVGRIRREQSSQQGSHRVHRHVFLELRQDLEDVDGSCLCWHGNRRMVDDVVLMSVQSRVLETVVCCYHACALHQHKLAGEGADEERGWMQRRTRGSGGWRCGRS